MVNIGLTLYPGCIPSGLFAACELLEAANQLAETRMFNVIWVCAPEHLSTGIASSVQGQGAGPTLFANKTIEEAELDAILLPGMWTRSVEDLEANIERNRGLIDGLSNLDESVVTHAYCTSVSLLAHTGRLENQKATSTWWLANFYRTHFPAVDWNFHLTFLTGQGYTCASGVTGYLPTAMHMVETHLGESLLRNVTKLMLLPRPETIQSPFQKADLMSLDDPLMRKVHQWVEAKQASELNGEDLAKAMNVSERTLARKIKHATGESTMGFARLIKLNQASEELILSEAPISVVSDKIGYQDDRTFRRVFKSVTGFTPGEYRENFKRPGFRESKLY